MRTNVRDWNTGCGDSLLPITTIVLLYLANTDNRWSLHVWDGGAVVRILQEEYKDCPADYNLSFEYHTELNCYMNNLDWRAKRLDDISYSQALVCKTHLHLKIVHTCSRWHVIDKKVCGLRYQSIRAAHLSDQFDLRDNIVRFHLIP